MNEQTSQNEFSALVKDLREQILYLNELGVDKLEADLPEFSSFSKMKTKDQRPPRKYLVSVWKNLFQPIKF